MNNLSDSNRVEVYEIKYRDALAKTVKGVTEVQTPVGRIDVLSQREIIEVKRATEWKAAVGQAIIYSAYYPQHGKRIHLFGSVTASERETVEIACNRIGVRVTWADPILIGLTEEDTFPELKEDVVPEPISHLAKSAEYYVLKDPSHYKSFRGTFQGLVLYDYLLKHSEEIKVNGVKAIPEEIFHCCTLLVYLEKLSCFYRGHRAKRISKELPHLEVNYCDSLLKKMKAGGMVETEELIGEDLTNFLSYSLGYEPFPVIKRYYF